MDKVYIVFRMRGIEKIGAQQSRTWTVSTEGASVRRKDGKDGKDTKLRYEHVLTSERLV